jgi:hypothetical protein
MSAPPAPCPRCTALGDAHYLTCPTLRYEPPEEVTDMPRGAHNGNPAAEYRYGHYDPR